MYNTLAESLSSSLKFLHLGDVKIDTWVFRLHYVATVVIFVSYSLIVTMKTYAGDPIDCLHNKKGEDWGDYLDWFCFIHGTQSMRYPRGGQVDDSAAGLLGCKAENGTAVGECTQEEHQHYLWVALFVVIQAGISYLPHYAWHNWEGGRVKQLLNSILEKPKFFHENKDGRCQISVGSQGGVHHLCSSGNSLTKELAINYIDSLGSNEFYALKFSICEWLCLLVCFVQIYMTDGFLNNNFLNYGSSYLTGNSDHNSLMRTLPLVALCSLPKYGTGGHMEVTEAICVLPNNVVHRKFYLFLWFWLLFITAVTVLHQIYRVALLVPSFRSFVTTALWTVMEHDNDMDTCIKNMLENSSYSDWVLLSFFYTNLTTVNFQNFLEDLAFNYQENGKKGK